MKLIFKKNQAPGYSLVKGKGSDSRLEVVITYGIDTSDTFYTFMTEEELGITPSIELEAACIEPELMRTLTLGEASIQEPVRSVSEEGLLAIVAMISGKSEIPR